MRTQKHVTLEQFKEECNPQFDVNIIKDWEKAKGLVKPKLVGEENKDYIEGKVHRRFLDLWVVYYVDLGDSDKGHMTAPVLDWIMEAWGISEEVLHDEALNNLKGSATPLWSMLKGMAGISESGGMAYDDAPEMMVLTTDTMQFGAAMLLNNKALDGLCGLLDENGLAIIPSSVHELIVLPGSFTSRDLVDMIRTVNATELKPDERLSDNLYLYRPGSGVQIFAEE